MKVCSTKRGHGTFVAAEPEEEALQTPEGFSGVAIKLGHVPTVSPLGANGASAPPTAPQEGPQPQDAARQTTSCRADLMTASGQLSCPPPGSYLAVSGQFLVSAVIRAQRSRLPAGGVGWHIRAEPALTGLKVPQSAGQRRDALWIGP